MATRPIPAHLAPGVVEPRLADIARLAEIDLAAAAALAVRAKADGIGHPMLNHLVGLDLKARGLFEEAITELGLGLAIDPRDARIMTTVGFCLLELDRRKEAAQVFDVAIRLDPDSAETNYGYGWAAENIGALEAAESGFSRALVFDPRHAHALAGLSGLAVRRAEWAAARDYAERAVALDASKTDAPRNLARVELGERDFDAAERRLRDIIGMPILKPQARANTWIMLGDALDGAGRYREAFDAYATGKAELRTLFAPAFERDDVVSATEGARALLAQFLETPAEAWARPERPVRGDERGHAFLFGFPRSGTTLLEQVLDTHADITALGERPVFIDAEVEFLTRPGGVVRLSQIVSDMLEPFREAYWRRVREFGVEPRGKVFVDKHPLHTLRLPLIGKVFPNARMIFATRDPRDVVISCFRRSFNMNSSMYEFNSLEGAAKYYDAVMAAGQAYRERLPMDFLNVRYEELVADFATVSRELCAFLDVPWTADLENFAETARAGRISTPSSTQVGRGLYDEGVAQWRRYEFALEPVLPILEPWIAALGYGA